MKSRLLTISGGAGAWRSRRTPKQTMVLLALAILASIPAFSEDHSQSGKNYEFEFTRMVDTTEGFSSFGDFPAINNHGEVAYSAVRNDTGAGVFRIRDTGEKAATIASIGDGLSLFGDDVALNPSGVVAFDATTTTGSRAIFKGDGASRILIADSTANGLSRIGLGSPSINADGIVAFFSALAQRGSPEAVFTGTGGPLRTVASTSATGFTGFGNVAINAAGTVVFPATLGDGSRGVFTIGGTLIDVVDTSHHSEIDSFGDPVINDAGTVADVAFVLPLDAPEIFTGNARGITPRNDPANPAFASTEHPSVNNRNAVAFSAISVSFGATSPTGIFLEVSGGQSLIPVVRPGDKLFGSTVDHVNLGRFALNDRFQMAFSYTLKDGRSGIAIASFDGERE
jgi:hypothetical protein